MHLMNWLKLNLCGDGFWNPVDLGSSAVYVGKLLNISVPWSTSQKGRWSVWGFLKD